MLIPLDEMKQVDGNASTHTHTKRRKDSRPDLNCHIREHSEIVNIARIRFIFLQYQSFMCVQNVSNLLWTSLQSEGIILNCNVAKPGP